MKFVELTAHGARSQLLGERLTGERQQRNFTQAEAAARAGISRDAVQRAERGRGTVDTLLRLLAAYGIEDRLDLLLPEPETTPIELLERGRSIAKRRRVRHKRAPRPTPDAIWGDER